jgi:hypothetical protein
MWGWSWSPGPLGTGKRGATLDRGQEEGPSDRAVSLNPVGLLSSSPKFLQKISDAKLRVWAEELNQIWKKLGKKVAVSPGHPDGTEGGR